MGDVGLTLARVLVFVGAALVVAGAAVVWPPAGLIVAGVACVLLGLFFVDVEG